MSAEKRREPAWLDALAAQVAGCVRDLVLRMDESLDDEPDGLLFMFDPGEGDWRAFVAIPSENVATTIAQEGLSDVRAIVLEGFGALPLVQAAQRELGRSDEANTLLELSPSELPTDELPPPRLDAN